MLLEEIYQKVNGNKKFIDSRLQSLSENNLIKRIGEYWSTIKFEVEFSENENKIYSKILSKLENEGFYSSNIKDFSSITGINEKELIPILKIGEMKDEIIRLTETLMFTQKNFINLKEKVVSHLKSNGSISVGEFKDLANTSRKYAVPLLEYFDKQKITFRDGNERKLLN